MTKKVLIFITIACCSLTASAASSLFELLMTPTPSERRALERENARRDRIERQAQRQGCPRQRWLEYSFIGNPPFTCYVYEGYVCPNGTRLTKYLVDSYEPAWCERPGRLADAGNFYGYLSCEPGCERPPR